MQDITVIASSLMQQMMLCYTDFKLSDRFPISNSLNFPVLFTNTFNTNISQLLYFLDNGPW